MNILIAGDFCPWGRVAKMIDSGDFSSIGELKPITENADYSILNLECPIIKEGMKGIKKTGPNLHSSNNAVRAIKETGFDCER